MCRRLLILGLVGAALIIAACQFGTADPTEADRTAIRRVVSRWTAQRVDHIDLLPSGAVQAWTCKSQSFERDSFKLRRVFGRWWVYSKKHWSYPVERGLAAVPSDP
jgi:hypothetical protein